MKLDSTNKMGVSVVLEPHSEITPIVLPYVKPVKYMIVLYVPRVWNTSPHTRVGNAFFDFGRAFSLTLQRRLAHGAQSLKPQKY